MKKDSLRVPHGHGINTEREIDSAWGARGHMVQSADSVDEGTEVRDSIPPDIQDVNHEAELDKDLGGNDGGK